MRENRGRLIMILATMVGVVLAVVISWLIGGTLGTVVGGFLLGVWISCSHAAVRARGGDPRLIHRQRS